MHFYDEKPRKEMGFFGMELDQRNRGQRAVEGKTLVTGCKEMKLSNTQGKKFYPNFTLEKKEKFLPDVEMFNLGPGTN